MSSYWDRPKQFMEDKGFKTQVRQGGGLEPVPQRRQRQEPQTYQSPAPIYDPESPSGIYKKYGTPQPKEKQTFVQQDKIVHVGTTKIDFSKPKATAKKKSGSITESIFNLSPLPTDLAKGITVNKPAQFFAGAVGSIESYWNPTVKSINQVLLEDVSNRGINLGGIMPTSKIFTGKSATVGLIEEKGTAYVGGSLAGELLQGYVTGKVVSAGAKDVKKALVRSKLDTYLRTHSTRYAGWAESQIKPQLVGQVSGYPDELVAPTSQKAKVSDATFDLELTPKTSAITRSAVKEVVEEPIESVPSYMLRQVDDAGKLIPKPSDLSLSYPMESVTPTLSPSSIRDVGLIKPQVTKGAQQVALKSQNLLLKPVPVNVQVSSYVAKQALDYSAIYAVKPQVAWSSILGMTISGAVKSVVAPKSRQVSSTVQVTQQNTKSEIKDTFRQVNVNIPVALPEPVEDQKRAAIVTPKPIQPTNIITQVPKVDFTPKVRPVPASYSVQVPKSTPTVKATPLVSPVQVIGAVTEQKQRLSPRVGSVVEQVHIQAAKPLMFSTSRGTTRFKPPFKPQFKLPKAKKGKKGDLWGGWRLKTHPVPTIKEMSGISPITLGRKKKNKVSLL